MRTMHVVRKPSKKKIRESLGFLDATRSTPPRGYVRYKRRLDDLSVFASEDDECASLREDSRKDFLTFVESVPEVGKAALFLLDEGNLVAQWENAEVNIRIEIEFLGLGRCKREAVGRFEEKGKLDRVMWHYQASNGDLESTKKILREILSLTKGAKMIDNEICE